MPSSYLRGNDIYRKPHITVSEIGAFALHSHRYLEVAVVFKGEAEIQLEHKRHLMKKGDIMLAFPNVFHSYLPLEAGTVMCKIYIEPTSLGTLGAKLLDHLPERAVIKADGDAEKELLLLADLLANEDDTANYIRGCVKLMLYLVRLIDTSGLKKRRTASNDGYMKLVEYICEHCYEADFHIKQVAEHFRLSPAKIQRYFEKNMDMNFQSYITLLRMDKASKMLTDTTLSVTTVAFSVGFPSISAFNHAFKRRFGLSPTAYRKAGDAV